MIIGSGLIAKVFKDAMLPEDVLLHAAGVSDSSCRDKTEFARDKKLLQLSLSTKKRVIYFSSQGCAGAMPINYYYEHKKNLEEMILSASGDNIVLRVPQVASRLGNPNNLINFFYSALLNGSIIKCYSGAKRNLIKDINLVPVIDYVLKNNLAGLISFCAPFNYTPVEIVQQMGLIMGANANIQIVEDCLKSKVSTKFCCSQELGVISKKLFLQDRQRYLEDVVKYAIS